MSIKSIVKELLEKREELRDDDVFLYINVLTHKNVPIDWYVYTALSTVDYSYVVRQRALLQSKYPDLRWVKYTERQEKWHRMTKKYSPTYMDKLSMWWSNI